MAGDRLTPLDASFLQLEDRESHMHVAAVLVFDGDAPPYEEFLDYVARRLHLVPRYRQKVVSDPLDLGRPHWTDDPHFDLRYHVRATALPRPHGEYELQVLAGRVFSQQLNRDKPLWEMWLVEGLEGGRHAVLSKTHHAVVDGISG
ncbi:MAG: wax ester/triacylglycerol synthase family O-acyltransferase, partial [Actinomycetota bacterium]|nr:wax ester/triacylglycerol synthase family O-acyltransferase [Actinomycetota bacterium]